jgi:DNA repair exonuclease SbcCD nuclease subunit
VDFEYVAAGHIHRYQVLPHPMKPRLSIVYPGSIQRMSFAEIHEEKGFVVGETLGTGSIPVLPLSAWDMEGDTRPVEWRPCNRHQKPGGLRRRFAQSYRGEKVIILKLI